MSYYACIHDGIYLTILADSLDRATCLAASALGCRCLDVVAYKQPWVL